MYHKMKYQTSNPLAKFLITRFLGRIASLISAIEPTRLVDLGCGEGDVASFLFRKKVINPENYVGVDISLLSIEEAKTSLPDFDFMHDDFFDHVPEYKEGDLVIVLEVLEHLENPEILLNLLNTISVKQAVFSVPWEPFFRLGNFFRGKYWSHLGNHSEHIHHYNPRSFQRLLVKYFDHVEVSTCFPWLIAKVNQEVPTK